MTVSAPGSQLRWRRVFPGHEAQLHELRGWLAGLLPACSARDDVMAVATELAANAIAHTASGRGGFFAVEVSWDGGMVRVAVADGGGPTCPRFGAQPDPLSEGGRGLLIVEALAERTGICGDNRSRLVWADVLWHGPAAAAVPQLPAGLRAAVCDGEAALAARHGDVAAWFGYATLQWWALPSRTGRLVSAASAQELARKLDIVHPPRQAKATIRPNAVQRPAKQARVNPVPGTPQTRPPLRSAPAVRFQGC